MFKLIRRLWARRFWRVVMIGGPLFIALSFGGLVASSQNWFCNSCHIMNTYHASWADSTHKDVDCVLCHIPPGTINFMHAKINGMGQLVDDILGRTSGKPSASVSDFSCMRDGCHSTEEVEKVRREEGKFLFNHSKHLDLEYMGIGGHCTTCHSHVKGTVHFSINTNVCITCHLLRKPEDAGHAVASQVAGLKPGVALAETGMRGPTGTTQPGDAKATTGAAELIDVRPTTTPDGEGGEKIPTRDCRKCHIAPKDPIEYQGLKVVHSEYLEFGASCESCHLHVTAPYQKVSYDKCFTCHDFGPEELTDVKELHHVHSSGDHKVECFSCHGMIRHGPGAQAIRLDHVDCRSCHVNQHNIQQKAYKAPPTPTTQPATKPATSQPATGESLIDSAVNPMFMAHVDCTACHVKLDTLTSKPDSGSRVAKATHEACDRCHKPGLGKQLIPMWQKNTRELYQSVSKLLEAAPENAEGEAGRLIAEARKLLRLIQLDGSWGAHNPRYTQKLIMDAREKLTKVTVLEAASKGKTK